MVSHNAVLMPLLPRKVDLAADSILAAYAQLWPSLAPPHMEVPQETLTFVLEGAKGGAMVMPAPVPKNEAAAAAAASWLWPDAEEQLRDYDSHIVIFVSSDESALHAYRAATRVTAAIVQATEACGVYIGGAGLAVRGDAFVGLAQKQSIPLAL